MSPAFLATLRAAAMIDLSDHTFSDLMHHAVYTLFAVAIALQRGITKKLTRRFFLDETFREHVLAPKIADSALRDTVEHLDSILPLSTRQAVVRQFDILLSSRLARISFGLSPSAVATLTRPSTATITLANCGPSLLLPPNVARTQAINHVVDRLTDAKVRTDTTPEMLVIEEIGSIVKHPVVARYLLEGSRTARWKNLAIVCCAQDPSNAIPGEALHALMLNARWFMAFESGRDDASLLLPFLPPIAVRADAQRRQSFLSEMATLPPQHCYFVRKGLPPLCVRTRDIKPLAGDRSGPCERAHRELPRPEDSGVGRVLGALRRIADRYPLAHGRRAPTACRAAGTTASGIVSPCGGRRVRAIHHGRCAIQVCGRGNRFVRRKPYQHK